MSEEELETMINGAVAAALELSGDTSLAAMKVSLHLESLFHQLVVDEIGRGGALKIFMPAAIEVGSKARVGVTAIFDDRVLLVWAVGFIKLKTFSEVHLLTALTDLQTEPRSPAGGRSGEGVTFATPVGGRRLLFAPTARPECAGHVAALLGGTGTFSSSPAAS